VGNGSGFKILKLGTLGKFVPGLNYVPRNEDVWESGGIALRILNLGTGWSRVVSFVDPSLYPRGKDPRYAFKIPHLEILPPCKLNS
jgi:hypothetical protein